MISFKFNKKMEKNLDLGKLIHGEFCTQSKQKSKSIFFLLISVFTLISIFLFPIHAVASDSDYKRLNPVLNSPSDLTYEIVKGILDNSIESLTINYDIVNKEEINLINSDQSLVFSSRRIESILIYKNPFYFINNFFSGIKEIKFKIILGDRVKSTAFMFYGLKDLLKVPLFDTENVIDMQFMFAGATSLKTVPLFNTQNVRDMHAMFMIADSLTTVPLFDTENVTNMSYMFNRATSLKTVPLFNTEDVTDMSYMFENASSLTTVPLFNTENVTNMRGMFFDASSLITVPLFDTKNVKDMSTMFRDATSLTRVPLFNTKNVTDMSSMFYGASSLSVNPKFCDYTCYKN